jgi:enamine deaminase RidA (YjgF/YER057c/UK114 family)
MNIQRFDPGARMSEAVVYNGFVFLAGQVAVDAPGASVGDQTQNILDNIDVLLASAGSDKTRLLSATIWLSDISAFDEMNPVWEAWLPAGQAPARATVESRLAGPEFTVEIGIIAATGA